MSVNAGKGQSYPYNLVHVIAKQLTKDDLSGEISMGWLPAGSMVIGSGVSIAAAWSGTGDEAVNIGFRNSVQGATADPNAFTETALDLDAAVGHIAGDVVSAANLFFSEPAEVTATIVNTDSTTGSAWVYVTYVVTGNF